MSLQKKLMLILIGFTILPMSFVGIWGYLDARKILLSSQEAFIESLTDLNTKRLEEFFVDLKEDIQTLARHPDIYTQASLLMNPTDDMTVPPAAKIKQVLDNLLRVKRRVSQYLNVMLLDNGGRLTYALHETANAEHLGDMFGKDKGRIRELLGTGFYASDFFAAGADGGHFFMLMIAPILDPAGKSAGIIVFEIHMAPIYKMVLETTGLGQTGEILIAAKSAGVALFFNPLDPDLPRTVKLLDLFRGDKKLPIQEAFEGGDGQGTSIDYRDKEVFAVWRHLMFVKWGLMTKIDTAEVMASANKLGSFILMVIVATSILGTIAVLQVSKSISRPIRKLQEGATLIGRGDLDYRVGTTADDEIGSLGRAFDQMTANLKTITASRNELEIEIKKRRAAETDLRNSLRMLDKRVKELDCLYNLSRLVETKAASIRDTLKGTLDLIPLAFQNPQQVCAHIVFDELTAQTSNFRQTPWQLKESILVAGKTLGHLVVGYLKAPDDEQLAFAPEEEKLIHLLSERLGLILERRQAEQALVRSEQRFRTLVEHSLTAISIVQDDRVIYQNPEQEKLLGPLPRPLLFENNSRMHPDDAPAVIKAYKELRSGAVVTMDTNFRIYDSDDPVKKRKIIYLHGRISRIEFRAKEALLINLVDLTKVKNLEKLLIIQDKMASLGRVAAGIAHEIRNPLSGINIYVNTLEKMIERQALPEKLKTVFEPIQSASAKIESVIRRVMDFAKPTEPTLVPTDIRKPIQDALTLAAAALRKKDTRVELVLPENLPQCELDPHLFEEIILNFINNASDAMKDQSGDKLVRIQVKAADEAMEVRFADSGPGVPMHLREEIFEPFFTTKPDSTGIGLSLCHRIITDHGGSLHVESSTLGGAEFVIKLPVKGRSAAHPDPNACRTEMEQS